MKRATKCYDLCCGFDIISIHALVKRATDDCVKRLILAKNFNPRPREEGDPAPFDGSANPKDFNPRPREEGDLL